MKAGTPRATRPRGRARRTQRISSVMEARLDAVMPAA